MRDPASIAALAAGALLLMLMLLLLAVILAPRPPGRDARRGSAFGRRLAAWFQENQTMVVLGLWAALVLAAMLMGPVLMLDLMANASGFRPS